MRYFDSAPEAEARDPGPRAANLTPLTPIDFLERAADVQPDKIAIVDGDTSHSYAQFRSRSRRLAGALVARGIGTGDVVSGPDAQTAITCWKRISASRSPGRS